MCKNYCINNKIRKKLWDIHLICLSYGIRTEWMSFGFVAFVREHGINDRKTETSWDFRARIGTRV